MEESRNTKYALNNCKTKIICADSKLLLAREDQSFLFRWQENDIFKSIQKEI